MSAETGDPATPLKKINFTQQNLFVCSDAHMFSIGTQATVYLQQHRQPPGLYCKGSVKYSVSRKRNRIKRRHFLYSNWFTREKLGIGVKSGVFLKDLAFKRIEMFCDSKIAVGFLPFRIKIFVWKTFTVMNAANFPKLHYNIQKHVTNSRH